MAKSKSIFFCKECGNEYSRWVGQCSSCHQWNTLTEAPKAVSQNSKSATSLPNAPHLSHQGRTALQPIVATEVQSEQRQRLTTGISEFDRVLGGGLVMGSVILLGGDPGVGKSTLLAQVIANLSQLHQTLYISGEESLHQISQRCQRLKLNMERFWLLSCTSIEDILTVCYQQQPDILVVDSIQTVHREQSNSAAGSVTQVRDCCAALVNYAKTNDCCIFIIGHVTKEGNIAGPRVLEHMVDTVLYFEGESQSRYRLIRAFKNRFGAVNELAMMAMVETGLKQVTNPSAIFLANRTPDSAGNVAVATKEGSKALLIEVQALADKSYTGVCRRVAVGYDYNRLSLLLAILHRHGSISTSDMDIYINIVGGLKLQETAIDLAVLLAIVSSIRDQSITEDLLTFGEVGLGGEVRPVVDGENRINEAIKHGFKKILIAKGNMSKNLGKQHPDIQFLAVDNIQQAIEQAF